VYRSDGQSSLWQFRYVSRNKNAVLAPADGPNNSPPLDDQKVITVDHQNLKTLPSGKYSVLLISFRDAVGNFGSAAASTNLELW